MSNNENSENNELNNAVEQVTTDDGLTSGSSSSNAGQSRESTVTSTIATGTESIAAEETAEALSDSGAAAESSLENAENVGTEGADSSNAMPLDEISNAESQVVDSSLSEDLPLEEASSENVGSGGNSEQAAASGAQSVGGTDSSISSPIAGASVSAAAEEPITTETVTSAGAEADENESTSTAANSQTFEVNVESDNNADGSIDADDLPSSTTASDSLTFEVNVNPENDAPTAVDKLFNLQEDGIITFTAEQLLIGAVDIDGDNLSIESVDYSGADGVLSAHEDGSFSFAPNENYSGNIDLTFAVSDGEVSVDANIGLIIEGVNDIPVAGSTSYSVNEDGQVTISPAQLLANSSDVEGRVGVDSVTYTGTNGVLSTNEDGSVTFSPNANFNGEISLDVVVVDDDGATATTTAGIETIAVNDAPVVDGNIAYSVDEDGAITLSQAQLLANASDADGDDLSASNLSVGDNATVTANEDGSFTVTPNVDFNGDLALSFDVSDGNETVASAVELTINPVNDVAVVEDLALSGTEDSIITISQQDLLSTATDIDGNMLTASNLRIDESFGALTDNGDGSFSFEPIEDYNGNVPLTFTVSDGTADTQAHGNLNLAAVNDIPVLAETSFVLNEDNSIVIMEAELLANATDIDADTLSITNISVADDNGNVTQNEDGDWIYTPVEHYSGDANLIISVNDGTVIADFDSVVTITPDADAPSLTVSLGNMTVSSFDDSSISGGVLTGWQTDNENGAIEVNADYIYGVGDDRGLVMELEANPGDESNVYQNLDIEAGDTIELTFDISARAGHGGENSQVDLYFEGVLIDSIQPPVGWETHTYTVTATTDNPRLEFDAPDNDSLGAVLDVIHIAKPTDTIEDSTIALNIDAGLVDTDGSESMQSIEIDQIPEGSVLTDGVNTFTAAGDEDSVDINGWDLSSLTITPAANFNGDVTLRVTATSAEDTNGDASSTTQDVSFTVDEVNDPVVIDTGSEIAFNVAEDTQFTITEAALLSNASDLDSEDLIVTALNIPNASFTTVIDSESGEKSFVVTPNENFNGDIDIAFNVSDQDGSTVQSGAGLTVTAVNDVAVVDDQAFTMDEDGTLTITDEQLLAGATDIDDDDLSIVDVSYTGTDGVMTDNGDGTHTFSANENFNGEISAETLSFSVSDGTDVTDASMSITVNDLNDIPVAGSTSYSVAEDGTLTFSNDQLLANSSDIDGTVSVNSVAYSGPDGILSDNGNESYSFAPNANFNGSVFLDVTVVDDDGATATTTAGIDVIAVNDTPVVSGDLAYAVDEDGSITFSQEQLLANASDLDGDDLLASDLSAGNAEVTDNGDGTFTVVPVADFNGDIQLRFDVSDAGGITVQGGIELTVNPINDVAVVEDQSFTMNEDGSITITDAQLLSWASDIDNGDELSVASVIYTGSDGVFTDNGNGSYDFAPNENFNGQVDLSFGVSDGTTTTAANIDLTVDAVNDAPVAGSTSYSVQEDGVLTFSDDQLLANASDIDGDQLNITSVGYTGPDGILVNNADGTYSFSPNANFNGDLAFDIAVSDGEQGSQSASTEVFNLNTNDTSEVMSATTYYEREIELGGESNSLSVDVRNLNADNSEWDHTGEGMVIDMYSDGEIVDTYTYYGESGNNSENFVYDSEHTFNSITFRGEQGSDSFEVENVVASISTSSNENLSVNTSALITVEAVNDAPIVDGSLAYSVDEDGTITLSQAQLLANASDVEGDDLSASNLSVGDNATVTANEDGSFTVTPDADFNGDLTLNFDVSDGTDSVASGVELTVNPINDVAVVDDQAFSMDEDGTLTITDQQLLAGATDVDGDNLSIVDVSYTGTDGVMTDNGDGTHTFSANENFNGEISADALSFSVSDGTDVTYASMSITVNDINDAPVAGSTSYSVNEDGVITISPEQLLANSSDVDGSVSVDSVSYSGADGVLTQNDDGSVSFASNDNFNGDISLDVVVIDDDGATATVNVSLNVIAVNDLLTVSGDTSANMHEDGSLVLTQAQLLANAADIDGDSLSALNLSAENATIVDNGDGTFSVTPDADFNGYIDIAYDISDGTTPVASNLGLTVDPVNDLPVIAADIPITIAEDGSYTITQEELLQFASDVDGDDLTAVIAEQGTETTVTGTVVDASTGGVVAGAEVTLSDATGNTASTTTDASGNYSVSGDISGEGNVIVEQNGSVTSSTTVTEGEILNTGTTALSEVMDATDMRIVVTWGDARETRDLDNHLWLYDTESGAELDHIYYRDMNYQLGDGTVQQDVDDTNGNGPETISVPNYADANMHYSVHNYSARAWDVNGVDEVKVEVFVGDTLVTSFTPDLPDDTTGQHWHVFDVVDGVIVPAQFAAQENSFTVPATEDVAANPDAINISDIVNGIAEDNEESTTGNEAHETTETIGDGASGNTETDGGGSASVGDISIENGVITDNGDGTYTITPNDEFNGEFSINYTVDDGNGGVSPAQIDVNVTAVNDLTVLQDQAFAVDEDGSLIITDTQLLNGATDLDNTAGDLSVVTVSYTGTDGVMTDNGDGTHTFSANENFNGEISADTLSFSVSDGTDITDASMSITVNDINDAPVAGATSYSVDEDGVVTISPEQLLANSTDVDGTVSLDSVSYSGTNGVLTQNNDGSVSFAPNANFNGDISLDVVVIDDDGATSTTTAGIETLAVNDVPVVDGNIAYAVDEDGAITLSQAQLLANASDVEGDELSASNFSVGDNASVTANEDGSFTVTPDADFNGDLALSFDVSDGTDTVASGVELTVNPVNDVAVVDDQAFTMDEDGTLTITDQQLLAGATDIDGDDLSIVDVSYTGTGGVMTDNGDGTHTFSANENFNGEISSEQLSFSVSDGTDVTDASMSITVNDVNDAPVAGSTSYSVDEDGTVTISPEQLLANSTDVDGSVSLDSVSYSGTNGVLTQNDDGSVSFAPNANFNGDISLDVVVIDDDGATATTTAGIETIAVNDVPVVDGNVAYSVDEDGSITINQAQLLANSSDIDGDVLTASNLTIGDYGSVTDHGDGTFTVTPDANFNGDLNLSFNVSDGTETISSNMDLVVNAVNDLPMAPTINLEGTEDLAITIDPAYILSQVSDIDSNNLTIDKLTVRQPENASLTQNQDGTYSLLTPNNFNDLIDLHYVVSDETGVEVNGELSIDIIPVDDAPFQTGNAHLTIEEDGEITFSEEDLLALFSDIDSAVSISRIVTAEGHEAEGSITDNGDGTWSFVPTEDFSGTTGLKVIVSDGNSEVEMDFPIFIRPVADGTVITTAHEGPLVFSEDSTGHFALNVEMLDASETMQSLVMSGYPVGFVVSDGEHTIEITEEGQMVSISEWNLDDLSMTPPEDFNGNFFVTISSVTLDEGDEDSTEDDSQLLNDVVHAPSFAMNDDGSILIEGDALLESQGIDPSEENVVSANYDGEDGVLIDNENDTWTLWSDPDYAGPIAVDFTTDANENYSVELQISSANDSEDLAMDSLETDSEVASSSVIVTTEELLANVELIEGDSLIVSNLASADANIIDLLDGTFSIESESESNVGLTYSVSNGEEIVEATMQLNMQSEPADYTVAPGGSVVISIPVEISANDDVDHMFIAGLPEGVTPQSGIESEDGYIISDLSHPVTLNIESSFSGDVNMEMSGINAVDQPVDGAVGESRIEVDESYVMQGSSADTATTSLTDVSTNDNGDWTASDNTHFEIDVMDDSASFDEAHNNVTEDTIISVDENI